MFENLSDRLEGAFKKLRGHSKLTEENMAEAMREVRSALLEADVNFSVAKEFVATVTEKAKGGEVHKSLSPGQQVIKIVHDELVQLLGEVQTPIALDAGSAPWRGTDAHCAGRSPAGNYYDGGTAGFRKNNDQR